MVSYGPFAKNCKKKDCNTLLYIVRVLYRQTSLWMFPYKCYFVKCLARFTGFSYLAGAVNYTISEITAFPYLVGMVNHS